MTSRGSNRQAERPWWSPPTSTSASSPTGPRDQDQAVLAEVGRLVAAHVDPTGAAQ
jgi:hypothetical protein